MTEAVTTLREFLPLVDEELRQETKRVFQATGEQSKAYIHLREVFHRRTGRLVRPQTAMGLVKRLVKEANEERMAGYTADREAELVSLEPQGEAENPWDPE